VASAHHGCSWRSSWRKKKSERSSKWRGNGIQRSMAAIIWRKWRRISAGDEKRQNRKHESGGK